ncbi:DUF6228 family protein [Streptomyces sp. AS58]|uniref:DUF6228 family protein n=1 Tax=Streptomyces sp. AS58 TaxID=1519489 RepID=UPI002D21AF2B|nr:DUF6228 family protein [Streptomyces sp. AS58]
MNGARAWCSLERDLTVSAKHVGSHVRLPGGVHHPFPGDEGHFEVGTDHAPGEDMCNLALELRGFPEADPLGIQGDRPLAPPRTAHAHQHPDDPAGLVRVYLLGHGSSGRVSSGSA